MKFIMQYATNDTTTMETIRSRVAFHTPHSHSILKQKEWANPPNAQDTDLVDLSGIKWRKGYGEDADSVEVLVDQKPQLRAEK